MESLTYAAILFPVSNLLWASPGIATQLCIVPVESFPYVFGLQYVKHNYKGLVVI